MKLAVSVVVVTLGWPAAAHAVGVLCARVDPDDAAVDGMLDEWTGSGQSAGAPGSADARVTVRCATDGDRLLLAVEVVDERVLRGRGGRPSARTDDHVTIGLRGADGATRRALVAFPGVDGVAPARTWNGQRVPAGMAIEDSLTERGWALEAAVPRAAIPGWGAASPAVLFDVAYADVDLASEGRVQDTLTLEGRLVFPEAAAAYKAFLTEQRLGPRDLRIDALVDVDGEPGSERVLAGGRVIGVLTDQYVYLTLPVDRPADVLATQLVPLDAKGRQGLLAAYRQRGSGGTRDIVAVWRVAADGSFQRLVAVEVAKQMGESSLVNRWHVAPRPKGGSELIVDAGTATGWDEDSYAETPADDLVPILLPWGDEKTAHYPVP